MEKRKNDRRKERRKQTGLQPKQLYIEETVLCLLKGYSLPTFSHLCVTNESLYALMRSSAWSDSSTKIVRKVFVF